MIRLRNLIPPFVCFFPAVWLGTELTTPFVEMLPTLPTKVQIDLPPPKLKRTQVSAEIPIAKLSDEQILEQIEKPIFSPKRARYQPVQKIAPKKPKVVKKKAPKPPPPPMLPAPKFLLLGVITANGSVSALIRAQEEEKWYATGDTLGDWSIAEVYSDGIRLVHDKQAFTLHLQR